MRKCKSARQLRGNYFFCMSKKECKSKVREGRRIFCGILLENRKISVKRN